MMNLLPEDFDPNVYLRLHPDVKAAGVDPAKHYLEFGINENRKYKESIISLKTELAKYDSNTPSDINAFNLFRDSWSTALNNDSGQTLTIGNFDGTNDERLRWLVSNIDVKSLKILELGPLEAAHSVFLEKLGADVLAIEANIGAFLRCLTVKNQYDLKAKFLLGDFNKLKTEKNQFDLVLASGVLYHMADPVSFLEKFSRCSDKLFLWTHYFESDLSLWNINLKEQLDNGKWNYKNPEIVRYKGVDIKIIKQQYGESLGWSGFCGGPEDYSYWIDKADLLKLLKALGYKKIDLAFDDPAHQNGPSFCVYACK